MKTQQKGFTLIELIIVIVVLGILAVTAAPQFFNFSKDARKSAIQGLAGAANSARDIVHGKALIEGIENDASETTADGVAVVYGYPAATASGIIKALNLSDTEWGFVVVGESDGSTDVADDDLIIFPADYPSADDFSNAGAARKCYVVYTEAANATTPAVVKAVTSGC